MHIGIKMKRKDIYDLWSEKTLWSRGLYKNIAALYGLSLIT